MAKDGAVRVRRVVCAVDCGTVVNPDTVQAQIQSAIVFGGGRAAKKAFAAGRLSGREEARIAAVLKEAEQAYAAFPEAKSFWS